MKKKRPNTKIQRTGAKISFRDCFVQPAADLERWAGDFMHGLLRQTGH